MSHTDCSQYLVIVALNNPQTDTPDLSTLKSFVFSSVQGVSYKPGCWHHPIIGLPQPGKSLQLIDFVCFVYERNENQQSPHEDTEECFLNQEQMSISVSW